MPADTAGMEEGTRCTGPASAGLPAFALCVRAAASALMGFPGCGATTEPAMVPGTRVGCAFWVPLPAAAPRRAAVMRDAGTELRRIRASGWFLGSLRPAAMRSRRPWRRIQGWSSIWAIDKRRAGSRTCRQRRPQEQPQKHPYAAAAQRAQWSLIIVRLRLSSLLVPLAHQHEAHEVKGVL